MGLDTYAFTTVLKIPAVDFGHPDDSFGIYHWQKHFGLHDWLADLYFRKGGHDRHFNCSFVRLDVADLEDLAKELNGWIPFQDGVSITASREKGNMGDGHFIRRARYAIAGGMHIYVVSWW